MDISQLGLAVKKLQARHHREATKQLSAFDVSLPQWDMLRHLGENPDASLHDLAVMTFQTDQSAGTLAARMVSRGLLTRTEGPGRAVRHRITAEGEQIRVAGAAVLRAVLEDTLGRLTPAERDTLAALLLKTGVA